MNAVLDAQAILGYFQDEPGSDALEGLLEEVQRGDRQAWLNVVNLAEVRYILLRRARARADALVQWLLDAGVKLAAAEETWRLASEIKAAHAISLADAFALATAALRKATLYTRDDPDFDVAPAYHVELVRLGAPRRRQTD